MCGSSRAICFLPFLVRHGRMMGNPVVQVVLVWISIHPRSFLIEHPVVLRTGERREEEKLEDIDRKRA